MDQNSLSALRAELQELYVRHRADLPAYAWESEAGRWAELVFCLLHQCGGREPTLVRRAVSILEELGLLNVERLAALAEARDQSEDRVLIAAVLKHSGFSPESARSGVDLLAHVARVLTNEYGGKIQQYLRRHGESMANALVEAFSSQALDERRLRYAITHWLQNALSLPLSLAHPAVLRFCERQGATLADLLAVIDAHDLNVALVDDLLEKEEGDLLKTEEGGQQPAKSQETPKA